MHLYCLGDKSRYQDGKTMDSLTQAQSQVAPTVPQSNEQYDDGFESRVRRIMSLQQITRLQHLQMGCLFQIPGNDFVQTIVQILTFSLSLRCLKLATITFFHE